MSGRSITGQRGGEMITLKDVRLWAVDRMDDINIKVKG